MGQNYKEVEIDLLSGKCVLFSGTPCQVAAIKSFLNKKHIPLENFYTIDIICHELQEKIMGRLSRMDSEKK